MMMIQYENKISEVMRAHNRWLMQNKGQNLQGRKEIKDLFGYLNRRFTINIRRIEESESIYYRILMANAKGCEKRASNADADLTGYIVEIFRDHRSESYYRELQLKGNLVLSVLCEEKTRYVMSASNRLLLESKIFLGIDPVHKDAEDDIFLDYCMCLERYWQAYEKHI